MSCQGAHRNTASRSSPACHTSCVSPNTRVSAGQPALRLTDGLFVHKGINHCAEQILLKRLVGRKSPNYSLLPAVVWVRRSHLEEGMSKPYWRAIRDTRLWRSFWSTGQARLWKEKNHIQETWAWERLRLLLGNSDRAARHSPQKQSLIVQNFLGDPKAYKGLSKEMLGFLQSGNQMEVQRQKNKDGGKGSLFHPQQGQSRLRASFACKTFIESLTRHIWVFSAESVSLLPCITMVF